MHSKGYGITPDKTPKNIQDYELSHNKRFLRMKRDENWERAGNGNKENLMKITKISRGNKKECISLLCHLFDYVQNGESCRRYRKSF